MKHSRDIERGGVFARPRLPSIEASILQALARGRSVAVSRDAVAEALSAEAEDTEATCWAVRLADAHGVRWSRHPLRRFVFALKD